MFSLKTDLFKGIAHPVSCASRGIYIYLFLCLAAAIAAYLTGILPHFSPLKDNLSLTKLAILRSELFHWQLCYKGRVLDKSSKRLFRTP